MPTYEYRCKKCGHRFERFQSITAKPLRRCPECRGSVKRLIGAGAGVIFHGSGFYATDYRSPSYTKEAKKESSDTPSGGAPSKGEKKEKAKPDPK